MSDRGVAVLMAPLVVLLAGLGLLAVSISAAVLDAAGRARAAADAAALAAAPRTIGGTATAAASAMARANGARLLDCTCPTDRSFHPRTVEVEVEADAVLPVLGPWAVRADARAEFRPADLLRAAVDAADPTGTIARWRGSGRTTGGSSPRRSSRTSATASPASPIRGSPPW